MGALSDVGLVGYTLVDWGGVLMGGILGVWVGGLVSNTLGDCEDGSRGRTLGCGCWC